jgi:bifunctional NMN adenylyltransferase/nudix hydrolase
VAEETGIEITDPIYVGSHLVDDWRYRDEPDKIKTLLFRATLLYGKPEPKDDIERLTWVVADELQPSIIVPEHRPLLELLRKAHVHV